MAVSTRSRRSSPTWPKSPASMVAGAAAVMEFVSAAPGAGLNNRLNELVRVLGRSDDPHIRQRIAEIYVHARVAGMTNQRAMAKIRAGQIPGPEMSIAKLSLTQNMQRIGAAVTAVLGPRMAADSGEWGTYSWSEFVLGVPGMRVAGGTDEIMRTIVGERVLGLPKEPRVDA